MNAGSARQLGTAAAPALRERPRGERSQFLPEPLGRKMMHPITYATPPKNVCGVRMIHRPFSVRLPFSPAKVNEYNDQSKAAHKPHSVRFPVHHLDLLLAPKRSIPLRLPFQLSVFSPEKSSPNDMDTAVNWLCQPLGPFTASFQSGYFRIGVPHSGHTPDTFPVRLYPQFWQ